MLLEKIKAIVFPRKVSEEKQAALKDRLEFAMSQSRPEPNDSQPNMQ